MRDFFNYLDGLSNRAVKPLEVTDALSTYVTRKSLIGYLQDITASEITLESNVGFRYRHQLGFEKYILFESNGIFHRRVRMHVWRSKHLLSDIHDHAYSFASIVLLGALRNDVYIQSHVGNSFSRSIYSANGRTCAPLFLDNDNVTLRVVQSSLISEGNSYFLSHDDLHTSISEADITVTVQVQDTSFEKEVSVIRSIGQKSSLPSEPSKLSYQDSIRSLNEVIELLKELEA